MARRGENIRKRKDGRWEARIKRNRNDKKYVSLYGKSYREVKEKKAKWMISNSENKRRTAEKTLSEVIDLWQKNSYLWQKDATRMKYQFVLEHHITPQLGEIPVSRIDSLLIHQFFSQKLQNGRLDCSGGLKPSYLKVMSCVLNSVIRFAAEQNYCKPVKFSLNVPQKYKTEPPVLEPYSQLRLESEISNHVTLTGLGILLSLNAGLRIGEVCALKWEDIRLADSKCISVHHTVSRIPCTASDEKAKTHLIIETPKTYASLRDIPISSRLEPVLTEMRKKAVSDYVISEKETFLSPRTYEYRFHKLLETYDIPQVNYHALRHTFATRCIEAGVDVKTLSELMGHSNVSTTLNTYVHSSMDLKRRQIEKLAKIYG